jgi:DNA-binding response OmpR family regulator
MRKTVKQGRQKFLKKGLGEAGFVVDVAGDRLEGLHLAQEVAFDLVILDIMIPSLDGWQVLTRLRQSRWLAMRFTSVRGDLNSAPMTIW